MTLADKITTLDDKSKVNQALLVNIYDIHQEQLNKSYSDTFHWVRVLIKDSKKIIKRRLL